jgi:hypothetical protein
MVYLWTDHKYKGVFYIFGKNSKLLGEGKKIFRVGAKIEGQTGWVSGNTTFLLVWPNKIVYRFIYNTHRPNVKVYWWT